MSGADTGLSTMQAEQINRFLKVTAAYLDLERYTETYVVSSSQVELKTPYRQQVWMHNAVGNAKRVCSQTQSPKRGVI